jgi:hypothetical protein
MKKIIYCLLMLPKKCTSYSYTIKTTLFNIKSIRKYNFVKYFFLKKANLSVVHKNFKCKKKKIFVDKREIRSF